MIVKDYRTPFGRHEVQPTSFSVLDLKFAGMPGEGLTWRNISARVRFTDTRPPPREPVAPVPRLVVCRCGTTFETLNPIRIHCSTPCVHAAYRANNPRPSRAKIRVKPVATCGHDTLPVIAFGQCRPCYARAWRRKKKVAA